MISDDYFIAMNAKKLKEKTKRKEMLERGKEFELVIYNKFKLEYKNLVDNNIKNKWSTVDFTDDIAKVDIECKNRYEYSHNHFDRDCRSNGIMYGRNKFDYGIERLKLGYRHIIFWNCADGIFFWELKDPEKQKHEYSFNKNCNKQIGQEKKDIVYIKIKYLCKLI